MEQTTPTVQAIVVRGLKTFLQAFLGALSIGVLTATDLAATKALIAGAVAAGVSAVMNLFLKPTQG